MPGAPSATSVTPVMSEILEELSSCQFAVMPGEGYRSYIEAMKLMPNLEYICKGFM